jgi:hypothetical protein
VAVEVPLKPFGVVMITFGVLLIFVVVLYLGNLLKLLMIGP